MKNINMIHRKAKTVSLKSLSCQAARLPLWLAARLHARLPDTLPACLLACLHPPNCYMRNLLGWLETRLAPMTLNYLA